MEKCEKENRGRKVRGGGGKRKVAVSDLDTCPQSSECNGKPY